MMGQKTLKEIMHLNTTIASITVVKRKNKKSNEISLRCLSRLPEKYRKCQMCHFCVTMDPSKMRRGVSCH